MPRFVFISSPSGGGNPGPITMTAGNFINFIYGYGDSSIGSVSSATFSGFTLVQLFTQSASSLSLAVTGDQVSALAGKSLYIDATQYSLASADFGPTYDSGSNLTEASWVVSANFVEAQTYSVDIY